jgi:hypothetical protein
MGPANEGRGEGHVSAYGYRRRLSHGPNIRGQRGDLEHQEQGEDQLKPECLGERAGGHGGARVGDVPEQGKLSGARSAGLTELGEHVGGTREQGKWRVRANATVTAGLMRPEMWPMA